MGAVLQYKNVNLYHVDIKSWETPVTKQFQLKSIPEFKIYLGRDQLLAEGEGAAHWFEDVVNGKVETR